MFLSSTAAQVAGISGLGGLDVSMGPEGHARTLGLVLNTCVDHLLCCLYTNKVYFAHF